MSPKYPLVIGILLLITSFGLLFCHQHDIGFFCLWGGILLTVIGLIICMKKMDYDQQRKEEELFFDYLPRYHPTRIYIIRANETSDEPTRPRIPETILTTVEDLTRPF